MVDTEAYYECDSLLERDLLRPLLLRNFGWTVVLVLTKDWLENPEAVMQALERQLKADTGPTDLRAT
jgi:very-short-patch-repair endonuclease